MGCVWGERAFGGGGSEGCACGGGGLGGGNSQGRDGRCNKWSLCGLPVYHPFSVYASFLVAFCMRSHAHIGVTHERTHTRMRVCFCAMCVRVLVSHNQPLWSVRCTHEHLMTPATLDAGATHNFCCILLNSVCVCMCERPMPVRTTTSAASWEGGEGGGLVGWSLSFTPGNAFPPAVSSQQALSHEAQGGAQD